MAVVFMSGFETQTAVLDNVALTGTSSYNTTTKRTGTASIRCNPASGASGYVARADSGSVANYIHFGLYIASLPSVDRIICGFTGAGNPNLRLTSTGGLAFYADTTLVGTWASTLSTATWYWIGMRQTSGTSVVYVQVDGVDAITGTATVSPLGVIGARSTEASAIDIYLDDLICEDTGFLASSKVALLLPISDNARATLWTGGLGGTTNLWDAVNNIPPAGLATETDTSQIEHAGGAAGTTDAYDANMTTYTTAGVGGSDTVLAVQGLIVWGEDSATGAKLLSYSGVSNPSWTGESSIDVSTGDGSGATLNYRSATPDFWNERRSAILTSPSVTVGTSPVMRVVRPETATRVASVCFMGMVVAWTPAVAGTYLPHPNPYPPLLAQ